MTHSELQAFIQQYIKQNGNNEITGPILQNVLLQMGESLSDFVNVNDIANHSAAYNDAAAARADVPSSARKVGLFITYLLADGWMFDQYVGANVSGWGTASNWKPIGPVSVTQNTNTNQVDISIGDTKYSLTAQTGYYVCDSNAEDNKTLSVPNFILTDGCAIKIKFTNANTKNLAELNINATGSKRILFNGGYMYSDSNSWGAGEVVEFYYRSSDQRWVGRTIEVTNDITYNGYQLAMVKSIFNFVLHHGSAFDLSVYRNGTTYSSLTDALDDVPPEWKSGGMGLKYLNTNNRYEHWYCKANTFTKTLIDWVNIEKIADNLQKTMDSMGGVDLQEVAFTADRYVNTQNSTIPNDGTNITSTGSGAWRYAVIAVEQGDTFLLNNSGGGSKQRAYAWVKSDFTKISDSGNNHTCVSETIVAPADAAWLVLNDNNTGAHCYKGKSLKYYIDNYVSVIENATTEIDTIKIGSQQYDVAAKNASERLIGAVTLASGSGSVSADGGATQNIIANTNVSIKKGSILKISISGFNTYINSAELFLDGNRGTFIYDSEAIFECQSDVSIIRLLTRSSNVIASGTVTGSVTLLNVYESLKEVGEKSPNYGEVKQRSEESDVNINKAISPIWRNTFLLNNASRETSSTEYISSDFIPVDTIRYLRITCSYEYSIFTFDKNKIRTATYNYSAGNNVLSFNSKPEDASIKYIRIRVKTNNSANLTLAVDSLVSRYNNERLLANKNLKCFAHRGSGLRAYPLGNGDNYPSSIWGSYVNGFDGIHINIQFTTDHVPYCLHDSTFVDGVSGETINLSESTSAQIDACTRDGQPIAKVESAIYMAKMMGLDIILYKIYGTHTTDDYDVLINMVKKYAMFEHTYFGVMGAVGSPNATYLQAIVSAYPKAKILRTEDDITSTDYSSITDLIADAESILQTYPNLTVYIWVNSGHSEQQFINANLAKPYNVKIGVHSLGAEKYAAIMPYIDIYTQSGGRQSFGMDRRDIEKIVTDKYPEFLLGDFGNIV